MSDSGIVVVDADAHRTIAIDRPASRNALDVEAAAALAAAVTSAEPPLRAIIITGMPPTFCAGGDLPALAAVAQQGPLAATEMIYKKFHAIVRSIRRTELPVIAAVNGPALGAGFDLALCCDLRIAGPSAVFESTWLKVGLIPGMAGARHLPQIVASGAAAQLLLLGRRVDAEQALAMGLVDAVAEDVLAYGRSMVAEISGTPSVAMARTKAALHRQLDLGLDSELDTLGAQQGQLLVSPDFQAVARRFVR